MIIATLYGHHGKANNKTLGVFGSENDDEDVKSNVFTGAEVLLY